MDMQSADAITSFDGDYEFLRNSYPSALIVDGEFYNSVEHAFQAAKTSDPLLKKEIREAISAKEAKAKGRSIVLDPDWDQNKLNVMLELIRQKFNAHLDLKIKLLLTGTRPLIQGSNRDNYWGVSRNGDGANHLGVILSQVRDEIRVKSGNVTNVFYSFLEEKNFDFLLPQLKILLNAGLAAHPDISEYWEK